MTEDNENQTGLAATLLELVQFRFSLFLFQIHSNKLVLKFILCFCFSFVDTEVLESTDKMLSF